MKLAQDRALVLFSGGQDSATCLAWALARHAHVETVGFDYGQRHHVELTARERLRREIADAFPQWGARLGVDHRIDLTALSGLGETAMTGHVAFRMSEDGLPNTFVPGRNLAFLVMAAALAYRRDLGSLVAGMCETDFSGYPDCRADTLAAQLQAVRLGMDADFALETPLMALTKGQTWSLAEAEGGRALVDLIVEHSHTCYRGDREHRHDWGYGCDDCPACDLRARGWAAYEAGEAALPA